MEKRGKNSEKKRAFGKLIQQRARAHRKFLSQQRMRARYYSHPMLDFGLKSNTGSAESQEIGIDFVTQNFDPNKKIELPKRERTSEPEVGTLEYFYMAAEMAKDRKLFEHFRERSVFFDELPEALNKEKLFGIDFSCFHKLEYFPIVVYAYHGLKVLSQKRPWGELRFLDPMAYVLQSLSAFNVLRFLAGAGSLKLPEVRIKTLSDGRAETIELIQQRIKEASKIKTRNLEDFVNDCIISGNYVNLPPQKPASYTFQKSLDRLGYIDSYPVMEMFSHNFSHGLPFGYLAGTKASPSEPIHLSRYEKGPKKDAIKLYLRQLRIWLEKFEFKDNPLMNHFGHSP